MNNEPTAAFDYSGSIFDSVLREERILDEIQVAAIKPVSAWQTLKTLESLRTNAGQSKSQFPL
jgi:hypothetical protein